LEIIFLGDSDGQHYSNMMKLSISLLVVGQLLLDGARAQPLPYSPTKIFLSPNDASIAYIFSPPSTANPKGQFSALNISSTIQGSTLSTYIISESLPFLENTSSDGGLISYTPAISDSGSIGVYVGSCNSTSAVWVYTPQNDTNTTTQSLSAGKWDQRTTTSSLASSDLPNANFLASSFYFSTFVNADDTTRSIYTFGGMCPTSLTTNVTTWQSNANYSSIMLKLSPSSTSSPSTYDASLSATSSLRPVPEAGFTLTGLVPTYSNSSTGIVTQARNYVLLGGHTKTAFIDTMQVALFSLPQEAWTFQKVNARTVTGTELAIKGKSTRSSTSKAPDSRSGHTAVLSDDGSAIVVFGGWVGDINTPADPQLLILRLGSGYGGNGDWGWELPEAGGAGLNAGEGIYGHGAVMLPGGVMMVAGGTKIGASSAKAKRDDASGALFLNTTSMTWEPSYTNPEYVPGAGGVSSTSSSSSTDDKSRKVGIGAGVGVGLAAVIGAIIVYFWYSRRLKAKKYEAREKNLQALSQVAQREGDWWGSSGEMVQRSSTSSQSLGNRSIQAGTGSRNGYGPVSHSGNYDDSDQGINYAMAPEGGSRNAISRKPPNARNARGFYQPAPVSTVQPYSMYDHNRTNSLGTSGVIHPIYEADEDADITSTQILDPNRPTTGSEHSDPFDDPPSGTNPPISIQPPFNAHTRTSQHRSLGPETAAEREQDVKEWVADWAAADAILQAQSHSRTHSLTQSDRLSPTKDTDRTASNLSERSAITLSRNDSTTTRSNSLTAFFAGSGAGWNPFSASARAAPEGVFYSGGNISPSSDNSGGTTGKPPRSAGSSNNDSSNGSSSFVTAPSQSSVGFAGLRAESETLLGSAIQTSDTSYSHHPYDEPGSPSKSKPLRPRPGWLGSLKKVLRCGEEMWVPSPGLETEERKGGEVFEGVGLAPRFDVDKEGEWEPAKRSPTSSTMLWRRKQGRGDWEDSADDGVDPSGSRLSRGESMRGFGPGTYGDEHAHGDGEEEEWDIEKAIQRRVVQVMFTVPKERLRVVNQDEVASEDGSLSEVTGSEKDVSRRPSTRGSTRASIRGSVRRCEILPGEQSSPESRMEDKEERDLGERWDEKGKGRELDVEEEVEKELEAELKEMGYEHPPPISPSPVSSVSRSTTPSKSLRSVRSGLSAKSGKSSKVLEIVQRVEEKGGF
jgi:hypothetical protein